MQRSNILVVIDPAHPDHNSVEDLVNALRHIGAEIIEVNYPQQIIEAVVATHEIPLVEAIGGVAYVRPVFTYFAVPATAAQ